MPNQQDVSRHRFDELFDATYGDLLAYAVRRTRDRDEAEDLVAEVFAVAWRRREDLPAGRDGRLWLFGIARLVLRNHRRARDRAARLLSRLATQPRQLAGPRAHPETDPVVRDAFHALSQTDREVLALQLWEGLSAREIAVVVDTSETAVWKRLERARTRLLRRLVELDHPLAARPGPDDAPGPSAPSMHNPGGDHA